MNQVNLIVCGSLHPRLFGVVSQHKCHNSKKYCIEKKKKGSTCQKCQKHKKERSYSQSVDIFKHFFCLLFWKNCNHYKKCPKDKYKTTDSVCSGFHPRLFGEVSQRHKSKKHSKKQKKKGSAYEKYQECNDNHHSNTCQKCQKRKKERSDSQQIDIFKHCFNLLLGIKWLYCSIKKGIFLYAVHIIDTKGKFV